MTSAPVRVLAALLVLGLAFAAVQLGRAPLDLFWIYLVLGALSFANYWRDKRAAEASRDRVPERSLLLLDLVFGIAGGLLAQALLRHKTAKPSFAPLSLAIAALHILGLALLVLGVVNYPA
ncbi:MAG TPA: DUF1294 domain-containing protein [Devosia sp.]